MIKHNVQSVLRFTD